MKVKATYKKDYIWLEAFLDNGTLITGNMVMYALIKALTDKYPSTEKEATQYTDREITINLGDE